MSNSSEFSDRPNSGSNQYPSELSKSKKQIFSKPMYEEAGFQAQENSPAYYAYQQQPQSAFNNSKNSIYYEQQQDSSNDYSRPLVNNYMTANSQSFYGERDQERSEIVMSASSLFSQKDAGSSNRQHNDEEDDDDNGEEVITDFSAKFEDEDCEDEGPSQPNALLAASTSTSKPIEAEGLDAVKTYCTEGTPYDTPGLNSNATSMSDLREDYTKAFYKRNYKNNASMNKK